MQIGLFGASFDPVHCGHQTVVRTVLEKGVFDQVWLVPTKQHPFAKPLSPASDRLAMLRLMMAELADLPVRIETYELDHEGVSYSYDTLSYFAQVQPTDTFAWIIGSDNVPTFTKWRQYQSLLSKFKVYVYPRPKYPMTPLLPEMLPLHQVPEIDVSSTQVREAVQAGQPIDDLVSPAVKEYIQRQGLYASATSSSSVHR